MITDRIWGEEFQRLLDAFPAAAVAKGTGRIYHQALGDIEPEDLAAAVNRSLREWRWTQALPSIADLRAWAAESAEERTASARARAARAEETATRRAKEEGSRDPRVVDARARLREMVEGIGRTAAGKEKRR